MKKYIYLFVSLLLFSSCGFKNEQVWMHENGYNKILFEKDVAKCDATAVAQVEYQPLPPSTNITQEQHQYIGNNPMGLLQGLGLTSNRGASERSSESFSHSLAIKRDRETIFKSCMYEKGYYLQTIED